jgi:O-antigen biosynthesis protein WbqV
MIRRLTPSFNLLAILHDMVMAALSFVLAVYLRIGYDFLDHARHYLAEGAMSFAMLLLVVLLHERTYRRVWRYTSLNDLMVLARGGTVALLVFYMGMYAINRFEMVPRSVPFIHWLCLMLFLSAARVASRIAHDRPLFRKLVTGETSRLPVLLVGATPQAEMFIRESERSLNFPYQAVGLIDDNTRQHGREIHHVRIYGSLAEADYILKKLARKGRAPQRVLLSDPAMDRAHYKQLMALADTHQFTLARLPSLTELKRGERMYDVHPVAVEDILGRPQATLDCAAMQALVAGQRVLVTGAGGSIGSELVRQIARYGPAQILLYEQSEYSLYEIDRELSLLAPQLTRIGVIGDVRDGDQLDRVFAQFKPQLVFHAAAIKHVPLAELNPDQAILTNVLGSKQVADACVAHHVGVMVVVSTDKAVNPSSVMGASKRIAEIYCQMLAQDGADTRFITVRFGNVLNSAGSVVPLFQKQIAAGGPLTVTHKDMARYFMTIREAVQLVLQAAALGTTEDEHAPIYVLDMGEPVKIEALACQMIRLAGLRPYQDIQITFTGLRPGEKLFEELFHDAENLLETAHASIRRARARSLDRVAILKAMANLTAAAREGKCEHIRPLIKTLVEEYECADGKEAA